MKNSLGVPVSILALSLPGLGLGCSSSSDPSSSSSGNCAAQTLTCADILPTATLLATLPVATEYTETAHPRCTFKAPSTSSFSVFCGGEELYASQLANAQKAFPGSVTETDSVGQKSFEVVVGAPATSGSTAEVAALSTNGKFVFDISLGSAAANIDDTRVLAAAIDTNLSK